MKKLVTATVLSVSLLTTVTVTSATAPTKILPVPQELFIAIPTSNLSPVVDTLQRKVIPTSRPGISQVEPKPKVVVKSPVERITGNSIQGRASWYCRAGVSICHYKYGPGTMSAAAGPRLRSAIGKNWRGTVVSVTSGSVTVNVKLVDWCQCYKGQSHEKIIDLYWIAFKQLPNNKVTVSWSK